MQKKYSSALITINILKYCFKASTLYTLVLLIVPIILSLTPFASAYIFKTVIDTFISQINNGVNISQFIFLSILLVVINYLSSVVYSLKMYAQGRLKDKLSIVISTIFYTKLNNIAYSVFEDSKTYDKISEAERFFDWVPLELLQTIPNSIGNIISCITGIIILFTVAWWVPILIILLTLPKYYLSKMTNNSWLTISDTRSPYTRQYHYLSTMLYRIEFIKETKLYQSFDRLITKMRSLLFRFEQENKNTSKKYMLADIFLELFASIGIGISYVLVFTKTISKDISLGSLTFYLSSIDQLTRDVSKLFDVLSNNSLYAQRLKSFFEVLDMTDEKVDGDTISSRDFHQIEFKNVSFKYETKDEYVFKNLNLKINNGEKIAIVGINGSGKTTLVKILLRLYELNEGQILIDNIDISTLSKKDWYLYFGVFFQDFNKYAFSAKENIEFGDPSKHNEDSYLNAKIQSDAKEIIDGLENKDEQILTNYYENGVDLSGGQWQRIALARMYYRDSKILILDEPTAAIDAISEARIFQNVQELSKNKTIIIISHRFSTVRKADRIIVLDKGTIIEEGNHEELLKIEGKYKEMFTLQAEGYK